VFHDGNIRHRTVIVDRSPSTEVVIYYRALPYCTVPSVARTRIWWLYAGADGMLMIHLVEVVPMPAAVLGGKIRYKKEHMKQYRQHVSLCGVTI
jgi:hypothetical protein